MLKNLPVVVRTFGLATVAVPIVIYGLTSTPVPAPHTNPDDSYRFERGSQ